MESWSQAERIRRGVSGLIILGLVPVALMLIQGVSLSWKTARVLAHTPTLAVGVAMLLLAQRVQGRQPWWVTLAGRLVMAVGVSMVVVLNRSLMMAFSDVLMYTADGFGAPLSLSLAELVAISPIVAAGLGMIFQALVSEPATARRLRRRLLWIIPLMLGATSWVGAWWGPLLASSLALPIVFTAVALATFWPRSQHVRASTNTIVVDRLRWRLTTTRGGERGLCRALGSAGLGILGLHGAWTLAALGASEALVALLSAVGCLLLAEAAAAYLPQLMMVTQVELSPTRAVVMRRWGLWTSTREVPAARLVLRIREDAHGSVLEVGDGEYVAIDASAAEVYASLASVRAQLAEESATDAVEAVRALTSLLKPPRTVPADVAETSPRLAEVLEPQRLWHARLSLLGPASMTWLSVFFVATTQSTAAFVLMGVSGLALIVAMGRLLAFRQRAEQRRFNLLGARLQRRFAIHRQLLRPVQASPDRA